MEKEKNLWGGRFTASTDERFARFNRSFDFDRKLLAADVKGSAAHCRGLERAGILNAHDSAQIQSGLQMILEKSFQEENFLNDESAEDVHSFIESRLVEIIGEAGKKLHTGRSRNDQVATALRIWLREAIDETLTALKQFQKSLLDLAEKNQHKIMPGYTHLQRAQPILFAHWCLAYFEMLRRDDERLKQIHRRVNVLPLGSAALAGTSYPIDRAAVAEDLNFDSVTRNSLDAVSDRDFCVEFVFAASLIMTHLSRFAEDIIIYTTAEFGFFELSDRVATGSSLMPQKKNPDSMELVRGKSGRVFGHLIGLLAMLKSLPLAYNKDMQEDKEAVFDAFETTRDCLEIASIVVENLSLNDEEMKTAATKGYLNATELADYLAKKNVPFRESHDLVGKIILRSIEIGVELNELSLAEMQKFSTKIEPDVFDSLSLEQTLKTKNAIGGTSPEKVSEAIEEARNYLTTF